MISESTMMGYDDRAWSVASAAGYARCDWLKNEATVRAYTHVVADSRYAR